MIKFGVAGYPLAFFESEFKKDRMKIFEWLRNLGLDAFEAQMTYGPKTKVENCLLMKKLSRDFDIKISVHAAYYIVLTSNDKLKIQRSIETLKRTYELAFLMGSDVIVLHPGPYYKRNPVEVLETLHSNLELFFQNFKESNIGLFLETAGKKGQLGSVDEILYLSERLKGCYPCIDFGHVHARTGGSLDSKEGIDLLFNQIKESDAFINDKKIHFHYTPIDYGPKGEISHKAIEDVIPHQPELNLFIDSNHQKFYNPRYEYITEKLIKMKNSFTVISETHNSQERGAKAMKDFYEKHIAL
jgi:deoxyribonuclease-4